MDHLFFRAARAGPDANISACQAVARLAMAAHSNSIRFRSFLVDSASAAKGKPGCISPWLCGPLDVRFHHWRDVWAHLLGRGMPALLRPAGTTAAAFLASNFLGSRAGLAPVDAASVSGLCSRPESLLAAGTLAAGRGNLADGSCTSCLLASMALAAAPIDGFLAKMLPPLLDTLERFCRIQMSFSGAYLTFLWTDCADCSHLRQV